MRMTEMIDEVLREHRSHKRPSSFSSTDSPSSTWTCEGPKTTECACNQSIHEGTTWICDVKAASVTNHIPNPNPNPNPNPMPVPCWVLEPSRSWRARLTRCLRRKEGIRTTLWWGTHTCTESGAQEEGGRWRRRGMGNVDYWKLLIVGYLVGTVQNVWIWKCTNTIATFPKLFVTEEDIRSSEKEI